MNDYKENDEKFLIARVLDKYKFSITKNKITYTDFVTMAELSIIKKELLSEKIYNYIIFGGRESSDRNVFIFYPEKFSNEMVKKNFTSIFDVIRIKLPNELSYEHKDYLSGIMKLGIKREKFGDIIVNNNGADIVCLHEISDYLIQGLKDLTRFKKSEITIENIENINNRENEFEEVKIIISSLRLDNFVSELAKTSRNKASDIILEGRVFVNSVNEFKESKKININDIITIRGKGKFIFEAIERKTNSERFLVVLKKYK